ncbi:mismatch repair ATPase (MutS family) [secondary endosymbiont of Heteropsylla cubana]|uniref:Mismatch repair ATPase (MutS family) n=1 Tax=secondary endosymbiont of Heteropsylla cubana TaxID=134287 RepID=J3YT94_9ENTR|nr:mismatch repair ATPase (MutS family) [secondary endosymbiont of Heteropsylla cubana]
MNYVCPTIVSNPGIHIKKWSPSSCGKIFNNTFYTQSIVFIRYATYVYFISSPNINGKSTYVRQIVLIVILAYIESFIPADEESIGLID